MGWVGLSHRKEKDWGKNFSHWRRIYYVREFVSHDELSPKKTQIFVYQSLVTICVSKIHTFMSFLCSKPSSGSQSSLKMPCKAPQHPALLRLADFLLMLSPLFVRQSWPGPQLFLTWLGSLLWVLFLFLLLRILFRYSHVLFLIPFSHCSNVFLFQQGLPDSPR